MSDVSKDAAALGRRRETLRKRTAAAAVSAAKVSSLDQRLNAKAATSREQEAALRSARDRVAALKKALKASQRQLAKFRTAHADAVKADAKAHQRVSTAEAKYDRAVLADVVQRQKERDLASHVAPPVPRAAGGGGVVSELDEAIAVRA
jgi:chromosome segregation ATPase